MGGYSSKKTTRVLSAYRGLSTLNEADAQDVKYLDITGNFFHDLASLHGFSNLETLVADENFLTADAKIPPFPCLKVLWVNRNRIKRVDVFLDKVSECCPQLRNLSFLKNDGVPSLTDANEQESYAQHRLYVVARLPGLDSLDGTPVGAREREEARVLYGGATAGSSRLQVSLEDRVVALSNDSPYSEVASSRRTGVFSSGTSVPSGTVSYDSDHDEADSPRDRGCT